MPIPPLDLTLYLVTDRNLACGRSLESIVVEAVKGGVTLVQLREKDLSTRAFLDQAFSLKKVTDSLGIPLIVNDRLDIALACGAAGVHLGQDDMACAQARRIAGDRLILGVSVSTPQEVLEAQRHGADYLAASPVFATDTKPDAPLPTGLEGLRRIRDAARIPLVAIGGINAANSTEIVRAGANGIAVVSAIIAAPDPGEAARALRCAVAEGLEA